ncbi:MAG: hypothetical protein GY865_01240 [candidate division Zixibacteria bacterium]|nr:hypothetical protein [candidate division Zixibacteria bacterium]
MNAKEARTILIDYLKTDPNVEGLPEISSCELSENKQHWIIQIRTLTESDHQDVFTGVGGYLIDNDSGEVEIVPSGGSIEDFLQDKKDKLTAGVNDYVLYPHPGQDLAHEILYLRQLAPISLEDARSLMFANESGWISGSMAELSLAREQLRAKGINCIIRPQSPDSSRPIMTGHSISYEDVIEFVKLRATNAEGQTRNVKVNLPDAYQLPINDPEYHSFSLPFDLILIILVIVVIVLIWWLI